MIPEPTKPPYLPDTQHVATESEQTDGPLTEYGQETNRELNLREQALRDRQLDD